MGKARRGGATSIPPCTVCRGHRVAPSRKTAVLPSCLNFSLYRHLAFGRIIVVLVQRSFFTPCDKFVWCHNRNVEARKTLFIPCYDNVCRKTFIEPYPPTSLQVLFLHRSPLATVPQRF